MWDISSPTRNWTHVPCIGRPIFNHWTTREVPPFHFPLDSLSPAHWLSLQDSHQAGWLFPQPDVLRDSESSRATQLSSLPPVGGSYSRSVSSNSFLAWALRTSSPMLVSTLYPWLAWVVIYCYPVWVSWHILLMLSCLAKSVSICWVEYLGEFFPIRRSTWLERRFYKFLSSEKASN